jgi:hypothetical protein
MADTLKPSHLGLDHEAQLVRTYRQAMNGANGINQGPAIKYIHLHECDKFSVRILILSVFLQFVNFYSIWIDSCFDWTFNFGFTRAKVDFFYGRLEFSVCLLVL